ncbi:MAG: hypothetical protein NTZ37_01580 [Methanoregula sp.]|nr:hypothetical protein [Methanoregula sp.]
MPKKNPAGYLALNMSGELAERIDRAYDRLHSCRDCPRKCRVNRINTGQGVKLYSTASSCDSVGIRHHA